MNQNNGFLVKNDRFLLTDDRRYRLTGWLAPDAEISLLAAGREQPFQMERVADYNDERFGGCETRIETEISGLKDGEKLELYAKTGNGGRRLCFQISGKDLKEKKRPIRWFVDDFQILRGDGLVRIQGWAASTEPVRVDVYGKDGKRLPVTPERYKRYDTVELFDEYPIDPECGFNIEIRPVPKGRVCVRLRTSGNEVRLYYPTDPAGVFMKKAGTYAGKARDAFLYGGTGTVVSKTWNKLFNPAMHQIRYGKWIKRHLPSSRELARQRSEKFEYMPLVSIVVPCYRTPEKYLRELVSSVTAQSYANWELILSDGSGEDSPIAGLLRELEASDGRIRAVINGKGLRISENTNAGLSEAKGEWIAFCDHDDLLVPSALYECVKAMNGNPDSEMIYTDEDKIGTGDKLFQPNLKPDFSPDFLRSVNYICHLLLVKRPLLDRVGMLRAEFDGAQDHDFILRCSEETDRIVHVPKILYHWRYFEGSTAANPESKLYAFEAGRRAVQEHYHRLGMPAEVLQGEYPGLYRTQWHWEREPLVSVLIPNKDHLEDLRKCVSSLLEHNTWGNLEIIVIENNSTEKETFEGYAELEKTCPGLRVVYYSVGFNFSAINNFGVKEAKGELLLFLNNDTESISDCVREMAGYAMRPDVGAVGARLYYGDDTVQHAGAIVGWGGVAGHAFVNQPRGMTGYQHRIICQQNYSAVTAACMMMPRKVFEEAGGFTEELAVAFNDIDLCMKVRQLGYLIVYDPFAELYHYESKSRGLENTPEKQSRFSREIALFKERWPEILKNGDPYYNPNLSMITQDFSLKRN